MQQTNCVSCALEKESAPLNNGLIQMQAETKNENRSLVEACIYDDIEAICKLLVEDCSVNESSEVESLLSIVYAGGDYELVMALLDNQPNNEDQDTERKSTPLMKAAFYGFLEIVRLLLDQGAVIDASSSSGFTPLMFACSQGHTEVAKELINRGANVECNDIIEHTPLMLMEKYGHNPVLKTLLDNRAIIMPTENINSPLTCAVSGNHVELALLLIDHNANIEKVNGFQYTPLMEAARNNYKDMVSILLSKGANINAQFMRTQDTALTMACRGGFLDVAVLLIKNGAILELGPSTPLIVAAQEGRVDLVEYLLVCQADVHAITTSGDTALTYACEKGHTDIVELLFKFGANIEHAARNGDTPLIKSCRAGHTSIVQFLISKNIDVNRSTGNNNHTSSCARSQLSDFDLLPLHLADPFSKQQGNMAFALEVANDGTPAKIVKVIDETPLSEAQVMSKPNANASRTADNYEPNAGQDFNSCKKKAMKRKA